MWHQLKLLGALWQKVLLELSERQISLEGVYCADSTLTVWWSVHYGFSELWHWDKGFLMQKASFLSYVRVLSLIPTPLALIKHTEWMWSPAQREFLFGHQQQAWHAYKWHFDLRSVSLQRLNILGAFCLGSINSSCLVTIFVCNSMLLTKRGCCTCRTVKNESNKQLIVWQIMKPL